MRKTRKWARRIAFYSFKIDIFEYKFPNMISIADLFIEFATNQVSFHASVCIFMLWLPNNYYWFCNDIDTSISWHITQPRKLNSSQNNCYSISIFHLLLCGWFFIFSSVQVHTNVNVYARHCQLSDPTQKLLQCAKLHKTSLIRWVHQHIIGSDVQGCTRFCYGKSMLLLINSGEESSFCRFTKTMSLKETIVN